MESYSINTDISWRGEGEISFTFKWFTETIFWQAILARFPHWISALVTDWISTMGLQEPSELLLKIWSKHRKSIQSNSPYFLVVMPGKTRDSYSSKHWFVFSKILNFCWDHLLVYNLNHTLDQWPNPYFFLRVKMFIFQQILAGHWGYLMDETFAS